jgi:hypothetical protein
MKQASIQSALEKLASSQATSSTPSTSSRRASVGPFVESREDDLSYVLGFKNKVTNDELLSQALCATPLYEQTIDQHLYSMADMLQRIGPRDGIEAFLAVQMVPVHQLAMASLGNAMKPGQASEVIDASVNRATKLLRAFTAQVEALDRHRRPSGQQMVVGNVNVNDGGQAIVGPVNHPVPGKESEDNAKKAG